MGFGDNVIRRLLVAVELVDCQDSTIVKHHGTMCHVRIQGVNSLFGLR